MAILPNFEYDIFISYRHNDNRSGWVTEFVNALQEELAATIKETLTIYFDKNPHDGLLETHHVDKSLEGKLKCLIFIPIISQTYCDTKSFAWKHEFCAFNKLAKEDQCGRDIKLSSGNVASRILPIKIHDIDGDDKAIIEKEIGGVLRAVEFIYKTSGVNRPLISSDKKEDNSIKTFYRDQVNKVANAIKEIIIALKKPALSFESVEIKESNSRELIKVSNSIAVLPFANMSSDPEQEFFSDGISEEIINMLAQVPGLKVAGRTSAFSFKGKNQDLREIGEKLNVNHILEGSVRKSGNKLRITAQLIKVADGYHLWSEKFDRELEDIFDIQDEIALAILNAIKIKLLESEKRNLLKRYTDNPEAYQLYLQGRFHMNQYSGADACKKGIVYYEAAIKIEPEYALAFAGIASSYHYLWLFNFVPPEQSLTLIKQAVQRAMELDNEIAESHLALGNVAWSEWDIKNGLSHYQKAIELNPNLADAHVWYAQCLNYIGNHTKAFEHAVIANNLDPFSSMNNWLIGWAYLHAGHHEKALELGKRMIELEPSFYNGYNIAGTALMVQKKYVEAKAELETALKLNYSFLTLEQMGVLYGMMGNEVKAREMLEEMEVLGKTQPLSNYDKAFVHIFIGEYDLAALHFKKGIEKREGLMLVAKDYLRLLDKNQYVPQIAEVLEKIEAFKRND
jgi:serine/threonine-protein kinase